VHAHEIFASAESNQGLVTLKKDTNNGEFPVAAKTKTVQPLFMATNRKVTKTELTEERSNTLSFFECKADCPLTKIDSWTKLSGDEFVKRLRTVAGSFPPTPAQVAAEAGKPVLADEDHPLQQHLSLFVHGYNNSWQDAVKRYAQIKAELYDKRQLGALVLYTWPSNGTSAGYLPDREDARSSGEQTADLFTALHDIVQKNELVAADTGDPTKRCKAKISIIAHSMGNYVVQKGLAVAARRLNSPQLITLIHQLAMVAADVDNDLFQRDQSDSSDGSMMANLCYRIGALYTGLDNVLGASAGLKHFGKRRLGRSGLADRNNVYDNVFDADVSNLIVQKNIHSAVFDSPKAMDFLEGVLRGYDRKHIEKAA
jgi:esterase/lipase superfamily enzyme